MPNQQPYPVRFRLKTDPHSWVVERGAWSPKNGRYSWKAESYHPSLGWALRFLHDRVIREGYSPSGMDKLAEKVDQISKDLMEFAKELQKDPEAFLEMKK